MNVLGLLAVVERWEAVKLAGFLTLDAIGCGDFPVVDGAEAGGVVASTVVEGSGEMDLRVWSLGFKVLEFRAVFDVFYLWIDDGNGICTSFGCVEIARHLAHFGLLAKSTATLDFGFGSKEAISDCLRD